MPFVRIGRHNEKVEEEALFDYARLISLAKAGVGPGMEAYAKYVQPLVDRAQVHAKVDDNLIALAILGSYLSPTFGCWPRLPQCSPPWLAFRRLFIAVCLEEIPDRLHIGARFQSMADADLTTAQEIPSREEDEISARIGEPLQEDHAQRVLKEVTAIRLKNYEGVTWERLKDEFVTTGKFDVDENCGAFFDLKGKILWDHVPDHLELSRAMPARSTMRYLKHVVEGDGTYDRMAAEYAEAAKSVRGALFDIATEATYGGIVSPNDPWWALENRFCERRLVEKPASVFDDERIQYFLVDGMCGNANKPMHGGRAGMTATEFLRRIASCFEVIKNKPQRFRLNPVKTDMTVNWLNPQFPLWLMEEPAIRNFLNSLKSGGNGVTKNVVIDLMKVRPGTARSHLVRASRKLITNLDFREDSGMPILRGVEFPKFVRRSRRFSRLKKFVSELPHLL